MNSDRKACKAEGVCTSIMNKPFYMFMCRTPFTLIRSTYLLIYSAKISSKRIWFPRCCIWLARVGNNQINQGTVADFMHCISGCVCDVSAQFPASSKTFLFCDPVMIVADRNAQSLASLNNFSAHLFISMTILYLFFLQFCWDLKVLIAFISI